MLHIWGQLADSCGVGSPWFGPHHLHVDGGLDGSLVLTHGVHHVQALAFHVDGGGILTLGFPLHMDLSAKFEVFSRALEDYGTPRL